MKMLLTIIAVTLLAGCSGMSMRDRGGAGYGSGNHDPDPPQDVYRPNGGR